MLVGNVYKFGFYIGSYFLWVIVVCVGLFGNISVVIVVYIYFFGYDGYCSFGV